MLIKDVKFTNYNGEEVVKECRFALNRSELISLDLKNNGNIAGVIETIVKEKNTAKIATVVEQLILLSYGEKSEDGNYFVKSKEISERFKCSPAYDEIFMEIVQGGDVAVSEFIQGILPNDIAEALKKAELNIENIDGETLKALSAQGNAAASAASANA